jgi:hypothetical protein
MAQNDLSPGFIRVNYSRLGARHTAVFPSKPAGVPVVGVNPTLLNKGGTNQDFAGFMSAWAVYAKALFGAGMSLDNAEFWYKPLPTSDPIWIFTTAINIAGTSPSSNITAQQLVFTYRTTNGGLFRNYLMETVHPANQHVPASALAGPELAYVNFMIAAASVVYGRDNGGLALSLGFKTKYNDVLRRKFLTG